MDYAEFKNDLNNNIYYTIYSMKTHRNSVIKRTTCKYKIDVINRKYKEMKDLCLQIGNNNLIELNKYFNNDKRIKFSSVEQFKTNVYTGDCMYFEMENTKLDIRMAGILITTDWSLTNNQRAYLRLDLLH